MLLVTYLVTILTVVSCAPVAEPNEAVAAGTDDLTRTFKKKNKHHHGLFGGGGLGGLGGGYPGYPGLGVGGFPGAYGYGGSVTIDN